MTTYIAKRILLMIPTLFMIVLLTFVVLNYAPGSPAQSQLGGQGAEQAGAEGTSETRRLFKQQFNLDKPVLFNNRFWLDRHDLAQRLEILADSDRPVCSGENSPENCISPEQEPDDSEVIYARELLNEWGAYVVPELYEVARGHERVDVRILALRQLSTNAQYEMIPSLGRTLSDEERKHNVRAYRQNEKLESWKVPKSANAEAVDEVLEQNWKPWLEKSEQKKRFHLDGGERFRRFFTDTRFAKYIQNLATLDFGVSHMTKQPVMTTLKTKVGYTIALTFPALLLAFLVSVPIGIWSATKRQTWIDQAVTAGLLVLFSLPTFFTGIVLLEYLAAGEVSLFPVGGFVGEDSASMTTMEYLKSVAWHLTLPVLCLTYPRFAGLSRYARTGIVDVIQSDYIRTARAKGLPESLVIGKHAVRNGMIPTLTILGTQLPRLIGGSIVIEVIFEIPGMGTYLYRSILSSDYNALMGILIVSAVLTLIGILISDISYALVDPRISFD